MPERTALGTAIAPTSFDQAQGGGERRDSAGKKSKPATKPREPDAGKNTDSRKPPRREGVGARIDVVA